MPRKKPPIRLAYATDLTDGQWALIEPMIPQAEPGGRPRKAATRELVDAILYFLRAGGGWRLLPHDLPPWQTVYYYLRRCSGKASGPGSSCAGDGRSRARRPRALSKRGDPRQPVRAHRRSKGGSKGFDAGKKISGRKRHILTDTDGRLLAVQVHGADIQDRDGGKGVLKRSRKRYPFVQRAYPMAATQVASSHGRRTRRTSSWRSSAATRRRKASRCCHDAGSWSGPSLGS